MSGGTDSSVAAMRLLEEGYEVTGVTFRFHERDGDTAYLEEARSLAGQLGMVHLTCDVREEFRRSVVDYFVREYMEGHTPVPCTVCNNLLKWPLLARLADEHGIFHLATGHYARCVERDGRFLLAPAVDADKDQTFFLWGLPQHILRRMLLPMGSLTKAEARQFAAGKGFARVAEKRDSVGICFCPGDYRSFLRRHPLAANVRPGRFIDEEGHLLGWHEGYPFYTVGQRRGLGIHINRPVFVKEISPVTNEVTLASLSALEKTEMWLTDWNMADERRLLNRADVVVKIRYRKQANYCTVTLREDNRLHVSLHDPLIAVAPGQAAAFYDSEGLLLGGGIIADSR